MTDQTREKIRQLKQEFHAYMNGVASSAMRGAGIGYRVNFGIELPRLQSIASAFEPDHELAQELWKEEVRESKIVATLLQPLDTFFPEIADIWAESITTEEMAGIASTNLFCRLPYASDKAFQWIASDGLYVQMCGYHTLIRLMRQTDLSDRSADGLLDKIVCVLSWPDNPSPLRQIVWKTLLQFASISPVRKQDAVAALQSAGFGNSVELRPYLAFLEDME